MRGLPLVSKQAFLSALHHSLDLLHGVWPIILNVHKATPYARLSSYLLPTLESISYLENISRRIHEAYPKKKTNKDKELSYA